MDALLVVVVALGFSLGIIVAVTAWTTAPEPPPALAVASTATSSGVSESLVVRAAAGLAVGGVALLVTGWIVLLPVGALGGWKLAQWWLGRNDRKVVDQERIEALAAWCEQLRDLLEANEGPLSTLEATVAICPIAIRPEVSRLATRIKRQDPEAALADFADDLGDASGDLVASVLGHAMSTSGRTAELLSELAETIKERANMRLRVEADRSGQRSEGRMVIAFASVVIGAIGLFGRNTQFISAYDNAAGQIALAFVASLFLVGVIWLNRLTRFDEPARFLTVGRRR